jgi:hypothetical protein
MTKNEVQGMDDDDIRTAMKSIATIAKVRLLTDAHVADFWLLHEEAHNRKVRKGTLADASGGRICLRT